MKNVLIALDYNPSAQQVAEEGYAMAKALGSEVTFVHVKADTKYYRSGNRVTVTNFPEHLMNDDLNPSVSIDPDIISDAFLKKLKLQLGNDNIKILAVKGECAESLMRAAKKLQSDVIIMGLHSEKWFGNTAMGSVTEKVLHISNIPVLIIPTNKSNFAIQNSIIRKQDYY